MCSLTASKSIMKLSLAALIFSGLMGVSSLALQAQNPTAVPVVLVETLDAAHVKDGDPVLVKTMQKVVLSEGKVVRKGAILQGHVVSENAFHENPAPYARQTPSMLSIHFDVLQLDSSKVPVKASLRAMADVIDVNNASRKQYEDDLDNLGEFHLVGGEEVSGWDQKIRSDDGSVVGFERKDGNYARLIDNTGERGNAKSVHCDATQREQSVAVFSADACGLYGLDRVNLTSAGRSNGDITLSRANGNVRLQRGTAALLMIELR